MHSNTALTKLSLVVALSAVVASCDSGATNALAPTPTEVMAGATLTLESPATSTPPPSATSASLPTPTPLTPEGFKIAFIGDQDINSDAEAVLALIRDEGADMVLHQGDFDNEDDPDSWD